MGSTHECYYFFFEILKSFIRFEENIDCITIINIKTM